MILKSLEIKVKIMRYNTFVWPVLGLTILLFLVVNILIIVLAKPAQSEDRCPARSQNKTEQEIKDIVNVFNNCPVAINYGMVFECKYAEEPPILGCYVPLTTDQCLELRVKIRDLATGISGDWFSYTGSKSVYVYNLESILIYYIKSDGEFKCIFDDVI